MEHFGGKWPFWLSPRQVAIVPVSQKHEDYAKLIEGLLRQEGYHAEVDQTNNTLNKKIRNAQLD